MNTTLFRIKCGTNKLEFRRYLFNSDDNGNATGCEFIQSLCGNRACSEVVQVGDDEIGIRQINIVYRPLYELAGVGRSDGKAETDYQPLQHAIADNRVRTYYYHDFITFFHTIFVLRCNLFLFPDLP